MGYPFYARNVGHLAGDYLDYQAIYAATASNRRVTVASSSAYDDAMDEAIAGNIDFIAFANGAYNLQRTISLVRTSETPLYIAPLNAGGVTFGTSPDTDNGNNQWVFDGCEYIVFGGFNFFRAYASSSYTINMQNGASNNRISGNYFNRCGGGQGTRLLNLRWACDANRVDHNVFYDSRACSVGTVSWDGSNKITAVSRSGTTATYTFVVGSGSPTPANGQSWSVFGMADDNLNISNATISNVTSNTFQATVANTGETTGTFVSELNLATCKLYSHRQPTNTIIDYNSFVNVGLSGYSGKNDDLIVIQDGNPRYGNPEVSNTIISDNWDEGCISQQYINAKGGGEIIRRCFGLSSNGIFIRQGDDKQIYDICRPNGGIAFRGKNVEHWNIVAKNVSWGEWGAFDGTGAGTFNTEFPETDNHDGRRVTLVGSQYLLDIGKSDGFTPSFKSDNPPTDIALTDYVMYLTTGSMITVNGKTLPGYFTDNSIVLDGFNYSGGGSLGITDTNLSNETTDAANFLGKFRPTSTTGFNDTAKGTYTGEFDLEGRPDPDCKGALDYIADDFVFSDTFAGSAGTTVNSGTPETNDTDSVWITPTTSWLVDGASQAYAQAALDANLINLSSVEQRVVMTFNAGGATNKIRLWLRTNASLTTGYYAEYNPNQSQVQFFVAGNATPLNTVSIAMSGSTTHTLWGIATGERMVWFVDGMMLPGIRKTGLTGTYCGFQHGFLTNTSARVPIFSTESDADAVAPPATQEIIFYDTYDGAVASLLAHTPNTGDSYTSWSTTVSNLRRNGSGQGEANTNTANSRIVYRANTSLTVNPDIYQKMKITRVETTNSETILFFARGVDANNAYVARFFDTGATLYTLIAGTPTLVATGTISPTIQVNDTIGFDVIDDGSGHPVLTAYLNDVAIPSATYTDTSDNFTSAGAFGIGVGNYVVAGDDISGTWQWDEYTVTTYSADAPIDPTAPIFTVTPSVVAATDAQMILRAQTDINSKMYAIAWDTTSDLTLDATGVGHIIAGEDPDSNSLSTVDSDTGVSAGVSTDLTITSLSASPKWKWAFTATASDDTEMTVPIVGEQLMAAPDDYQLVEIPDGSALETSGLVYLTFGALTDGSVILLPLDSTNGNPISCSATGVVTIDTGGQTDSYTINAWDYDTRAWQGEETINILTPYTITVSQVISSGSPVDGVDVFWKYYPGATVETMDTVTPESGTGTFTAGDLTFTVQVNTPGLVIVEDQATQARYYIGQETPS